MNLLDVVAQFEYLFEAKVAWPKFHQQYVYLLLYLGFTQRNHQFLSLLVDNRLIFFTDIFEVVVKTRFDVHFI